MNLLSLLMQCARAYGPRNALVAEDGVVRFDELPALAVSLARATLGSHPPGTHVVLLARNSTRYALLQLGLEILGHVRVPLNWRSTALEVANVVRDAGAAVLVHDATTVIVASAADTQLAQSGTPVERVSIEAVDPIPTPLPIRRDAAAGAADDAVVSINYTSGTLGAPKGAVHTQRSWDAVARNLLAVRGFRSDDVLALVGPLSHAAGAYLVPALLAGTTVLMARSAAPEALAEAIEQHRATILQCVPTVLTRLAADAAFQQCDRTTLRQVVYGAEAMPANTLTASLALFGPILAQNYGLTEAMMTCCTLAPHEHVGADGPRFGTVGRPYPLVEIAVRRPDGSETDGGETGELTVRSPHLMQGYWQRPEATAEALRDGWLWSGDLAAWDADGFLRLRGRRKALVISGGMNIYPAEVEHYLTTLEQVVEAAVFGVPDAAWGERLVAAVALRPSTDAALLELRSRARASLGIRCPKEWLVLPELPRTGNGKVDLIALKSRVSVDGVA